VKIGLKFFTQVNAGRVEGWKGGRMEGWKDGRMEGWKRGGENFPRVFK
jgi:hypothetical protein